MSQRRQKEEDYLKQSSNFIEEKVAKKNIESARLKRHKKNTLLQAIYDIHRKVCLIEADIEKAECKETVRVLHIHTFGHKSTYFWQFLVQRIVIVLSKFHLRTQVN